MSNTNSAHRASSLTFSDQVDSVLVLLIQSNIMWPSGGIHCQHCLPSLWHPLLALFAITLASIVSIVCHHFGIHCQHYLPSLWHPLLALFAITLASIMVFIHNWHSVKVGINLGYCNPTRFQTRIPKVQKWMFIGYFSSEFDGFF